MTEPKKKFQIYTDKLFQNPIAKIIAFDHIHFKSAIEEIEKYAHSHYVLGYIRYEAKDIFLGKEITSSLPLLYFEVYPSYTTFSPRHEKETDFLFPERCITFKEYEKAIQYIKKQIACGNTYEVNYTYKWDVPFQGDTITLYEKLLSQQKTPYNALIQNEYEEVLSFSPELFFTIKNNTILTKPMKGTVARKTNKIEDRQQIKFLKNSLKNKVENVMIVDLLRNDLSKIAQTGTVKVNKLFDIETHKTLHQMTSEIEAQLRPEVSLYTIFEAIFPCGSITGAPKIKTMEIIDKIENNPRHIYCGAIGLLSPEECVFSVPIRILQRQKNETNFHYYTGGAIVWDSEIEDEWEETLTKARFLTIQNPDFKIIETIKVKNGKLIFGNEHFKRMKKSAKTLGFTYNAELEKLEIRENALLRIALAKDGTYELSYKELKETDNKNVSISPIAVNSQQPLIYHKTSYRPYFENSMQKIRNGEIFDELFFNEKGELTEGARSNIILEINKAWFTPSLESGLLNGIYRQKLLKEKRCTEKKLYISDVYKASNVYCINSVRGITKVNIV